MPSDRPENFAIVAGKDQYQFNTVLYKNQRDAPVSAMNVALNAEKLSGLAADREGNIFYSERDEDTIWMIERGTCIVKGLLGRGKSEERMREGDGIDNSVGKSFNEGMSYEKTDAALFDIESPGVLHFFYNEELEDRVLLFVEERSCNIKAYSVTYNTVSTIVEGRGCMWNGEAMKPVSLWTQLNGSEVEIFWMDEGLRSMMKYEVREKKTQQFPISVDMTDHGVHLPGIGNEKRNALLRAALYNPLTSESVFPKLLDYLNKRKREEERLGLSSFVEYRTEFYQSETILNELLSRHSNDRDRYELFYGADISLLLSTNNLLWTLSYNERGGINGTLLNGPTGVFLNSNGEMYVVDTGNYHVRFVTVPSAPSQTPSSLPTSKPTAQPTNPSSCPTSQPTSRPTSNPTFRPTPRQTSKPTSQPTETPSGRPTSRPTYQPASRPTSEPSRRPTSNPTSSPSSLPTLQPTSRPSSVPSGAPISHPTSRPTSKPSKRPTAQPTSEPSRRPTSNPTSSPSLPTNPPSSSPTGNPRAFPTSSPSITPFALPTSLPTSLPTIAPSAQPLASPTVLPSSFPSTTPSSEPSAYPSIAPSSNPSFRPISYPSTGPTATPFPTYLIPLPLYSSPIYKTRSALSISVIGNVSGQGYVWGGGSSGTNKTVLDQLQNVLNIVSSQNAFVAVKRDGSLLAWGSNADVEGWWLYKTTGTVAIYATEHAFTGITAVGGMFAFGLAAYGGELPAEYEAYLSSGVKGVAATAGAFAVWKVDGSVFAWGNAIVGGGMSSLKNSNLQNVQEVFANRGAFAALRTDGRVVSWGSCAYGGCAPMYSNVVHVFATKTVFIGQKSNGKYMTWGNRLFGGNSTAVSSKLRSLQYLSFTGGAVAAVTQDGKVVAWGDSRFGGDNGAVANSLNEVVGLVGNDRAFAALTASGRVVVWGDKEYGGEIAEATLLAQLSQNVSKIVASQAAFAALKTNGAVVAWGSSLYGGDARSVVQYLRSEVRYLLSVDGGFLVIRNDSNVVGWGSGSVFPTSGIVGKILSKDLNSLQF
eukprot:gene2640-2806_t